MESNCQYKHLSVLDSTLVEIYITACVNDWSKLPSLAKKFYSAGGTIEQLRGCLRHLIVLAGYGPCLAAFLTLQKAKLLPEETPGKIGGPPGDAFELVYSTVTDAVRRKVHSADPVLGEWILLHLYGDIYSTPGIDLKRKQILMSARLAQASMGEQLFGHAFAGLRFGATLGELEDAVEIAFRISPVKGPVAEAAHAEAVKILAMSAAKFEKEFGGVAEPMPEPTIPDLSCLRIPELYLVGQEGTTTVKELHKVVEKKKEKNELEDEVVLVDTPSGGGDGGDVVAGKDEDEDKEPGSGVEDTTNEDDDVKFAWEELDPRN
jgi:alkylhydroperoxidase/carboxymuconolactone decarboxylase family protein YurZ